MFKKLSMSAAAVGALAAAAATVLSPASASAVSPPLSDARIAAHFDLAQGQTPQNVALAADGRAHVTFAKARRSPQSPPRALSGPWPPRPSPPTAVSTPPAWASR
ncbi:hypothetical protein [Streptomyces sp. NPDC052107]|uniref:hypothetical protein n=1 Tax=Streptomyces sp. NPDC052107 TaxID=3155632 RepID=UPI0034462F00